MFDLDGTLSQSKSPITSQMAEALSELVARKKVAIISGGAWHQFEKQVVSLLPEDTNLENLYIMPTSGTRLYVWNETWKEVYAEIFNEEEKAYIMQMLANSVDTFLEKPAKTYGETIEDRGSQITFSALGQEAPIEEKEHWDPDQKKRLLVAYDLQSKLPECEVRVGGKTSIDITKKGMDKAYGIKKLATHLSLPLEEILYIGDAIYEGGNDYAAKQLGLECVQVKDEVETLGLIGYWIQ